MFRYGEPLGMGVSVGTSSTPEIGKPVSQQVAAPHGVPCLLGIVHQGHVSSHIIPKHLPLMLTPFDPAIHS